MYHIYICKNNNNKIAFCELSKSLFGFYKISWWLIKRLVKQVYKKHLMKSGFYVGRYILHHTEMCKMPSQGTDYAWHRNSRLHWANIIIICLS